MLEYQYQNTPHRANSCEHLPCGAKPLELQFIAYMYQWKLASCSTGVRCDMGVVMSGPPTFPAATDPQKWYKEVAPRSYGVCNTLEYVDTTYNSKKCSRSSGSATVRC